MSDFLDRLTNDDRWFPEPEDYVDLFDEEDFYSFDDDIWAELEFLDAHAPSSEELIVMNANAEQLLADIEAEDE